MESSTPEISQDIISPNPAVPMATNNPATQIFLIKEELPSTENTDNQVLQSSYPTRQEQPRFVRITSHAQSNTLSLTKNDLKATVAPNELAQHSSSTTQVMFEDKSNQLLQNKKQRNKKKETKSSHGPYICDKCKKSFVHEASLKAHVRRTYCQEAKSLVSIIFRIILIQFWDLHNNGRLKEILIITLFSSFAEIPAHSY